MVMNGNTSTPVRSRPPQPLVFFAIDTWLTPQQTDVCPEGPEPTGGGLEGGERGGAYRSRRANASIQGTGLMGHTRGPWEVKPMTFTGDAADPADSRSIKQPGGDNAAASWP